MNLANRALFEPYIWCHVSPLDEDKLKAIGFFDDGLTEDELDDRLSEPNQVTPTHHLGAEGVVLVTTGAFSPFHAGHLRMLEIAKGQIEARGIKVAGAYVCPDHDSYVSNKANGAARCPASERIHQIQVAIKDHSWLAVDPWAALYQDRALNYTTILARIQRMLDDQSDRHWNGHPLCPRAIYVFGSDNGGFKQAFECPADYVCVGRPGFDGADPQALDLSSTGVRHIYGAWPSLRGLDWPLPTVANPYLIRNDLGWATQNWSDTEDACNAFFWDLRAAFTTAFGGYSPWSIELEEQRKKLSYIQEPYVSFDKVTANRGASISRVFQFGGLQDKPVDWLTNGLNHLIGDYLFVDDDISSGSKLEAVKKRTPAVNWIGSMSLSPKGFDIVDARDFLFGAKAGGLWITMGNGPVSDLFRAPYLTPWVNLLSRASIPPAAQPQFVRMVLAANVAFFTRINVTMNQVDNVGFWSMLGYKPTDSMLTIAKDLSQWTRA